MDKKSLNQQEFTEMLKKAYSKEVKGKLENNAALQNVSKKFSEYKEQARTFLKNGKELEKFLMKVEKKFKDIPKVGDKLAYIPQMVLLVRSYAVGEYRDITKTEIVLILAALIYFVSPIDVIPDKFLGVGWLDDALVAGLVIKYCNDSIKKYMTWLETKEQ